MLISSNLPRRRRSAVQSSQPLHRGRNSRDRAIKLLDKQELLIITATHRDISSSCRDQFDVHGALISRTFQIGVAEMTLIELDQQDSMLKLIDDDSGAALNRARHHQ